ncbi:DMT family transporter [Ahrensia sp. R2A130]|uniref:DMT family transporter n=1 Tax=Ahrensia sp. R2A130 TaxID=744979 RepID=UPI0001E0D807|nr:DMT family transporter [Ahrensia sp. R2A130]EFL90327.1 DMT family permease [Ahrensia sp. R2A130]
METWIWATLAAAFLQNLRSAMQKAIKGRLSNTGAAYARFFYAWPFAVAYCAALMWWTGEPIPDVHPIFFAWVAAGGLVQIAFTVLLMWMFSFRSFAVGTVFSKLEIVIVAIAGALLLGDFLSPLAWFAVFCAALGLLLLSLKETSLNAASIREGLTSPATAIGLLCATCLGLSGVSYRGATLSIPDSSFLVRAAFTLAVALVFQTIAMGLWFLWKDRGQLRAVIAAWRPALPIGIVGMACSVGWFTAFALQNAAYIRAVGQVELIFTLAVGWFWFREKVTWPELAGIALISAAVMMIVLAG